MKILKLDHELAQLVLAGEKTSTWRMYDDKDISVYDEIELLDKVDPHDRATWRPIGIGKVTSVIEKPLGSITDTDFDGHEKFDNKDAMLEAYRSFYGSDVSLDTPVKIIHFSFTALENTQVETIATTPEKEVVLYADGGSRGNPGPSASGFVIYDMHETIIYRKGIYIGVTTNNQAEYLALKYGLEQAEKLGARIVHVRLDSLLVVNQMIGKFKVRNRDLWPIYDDIKQRVARFKKVNFMHVPRELNKEADAAVNEALDAEQANTVQ